MVIIYVDSSMEDIYNIMVVENNFPVCSDSVRGRHNLYKEIDRLVEEYQHKKIPFTVAGLSRYEPQ